MAISMPKKKSKKTKQEQVENQTCFDSYMYRFLSKIPVTFLLLLIIFIWCSSTTIISGSIVHVCVTSRKLNNQYCFSAGAQPAANYNIPLPVINNSSKVSVLDARTTAAISLRTEIPSSEKKLSLNTTHKTPVSAPDDPKTAAVNTTEHSVTDAKINLNVSQIPSHSSASSSPIVSSNSHKESSTKSTENSDSTPSSVLRNSINIELPTNSSNSRNEKINLNVNQKTSYPSPSSPPFVSSNSHKESGTKPTENSDSTPSSVLRNIELPTNSSNSRNQVSYDNTADASDLSSSELSSPFINPLFNHGIDEARAKELAIARKSIEEQMATLRSYIAKSKPSDCEDRGIYVYDLPSKFNQDLLANCKDIYTWMDYCKYFTNDAMGEPLTELGKGWYNTHQYTLEPIFHSHILNHPCKVQNIEDAKIFYVPFYGGLDILKWHFRNVSATVKDKLSNELIQWLDLQTPWKRNFGLDHVLALGKISWDFRRVENGTWGTQLLELDEMHNPIKLLIERQPWLINDIGVPHPTYFHPSSDQDIIDWQNKIRDIHRGNLISFAGAARNASESIRSVLIKQCTSAPDVCKHFDCKNRACISPVPVVKLFMDSEFCLQPPGDSPTRKSFFDSLVAGCIPVVFDPFTAYYQYPWHLPEDYRKYSVYIDMEDVRASEVNVVDLLVKIPLKERQEMRKYIIDELMPKLVYSDPKGKLEKFEDAFYVTVNNLIELAASRLP